MNAISPGRRLREAAEQAPLLIPGVFNALVGKLVEQQGFRAAYLSGAAFSAGTLGIPDIGLFTLTELAEETARLSSAMSIPLIVDADTGFGEAVNVQRTVTELVRAGAAAIQLEDQQLPKRCGHLSGKVLVSPETMVSKLRAAVEAKQDSEVVLLARTDARGVTSFADAVERAAAYLEAGADWIFPEALASQEEFAEFAQRVQAPLIANMTEFGKSPLLPAAELLKLGYVGVLMPVTLLRVAMFAVQECLQTLKQVGSQQSWLEKMQTRQQLYDTLGYSDYLQRDRAYFEWQPNSPESSSGE